MASIGSVTCWDIRGRPPVVQEAVEFEEVPGLDGVEIETTGLRGGAFSVVAREYDTHANIESWIDDLKDLAGDEPVTITLGDGTVFDKCFVGGPVGGMGVQVMTKQAIIESGVAKYYCEVVVTGYRSPV